MALALVALAGALPMHAGRQPADGRGARGGAGLGRAGGAADRDRARTRARLAAAVARARSLPRFVAPPAARAFPGFPVHTPQAPELLHEMEERDPIWAPAMEAALTSVALSPALLESLGLGDMKVTALTCRQTTCALAYEYPTRLVDRVVASGLPPSSPMVLVEEAVGWTAPRGGGLRTRTFTRDGVPYARASLVLGFDEGSWEPARYRTWVADRLPEAQAFYRGAREARRKQDPVAGGRPQATALGDAG
jgi:hypothetical protein